MTDASSPLPPDTVPPMRLAGLEPVERDGGGRVGHPSIVAAPRPAQVSA